MCSEIFFVKPWTRSTSWKKRNAGENFQKKSLNGEKMF